MITKERFIKELTTRIKGIKPGMPTTTDFAIDEMKSLLILANALPEPEQPVGKTCKTCGFYENNCPFIRDKFIPYPNRVCKDYTYSVMKAQEQPVEGLEEAAEKYAEKHGFRVPYDGSNNFYDDVDVKASKEGFIAGAEWMKSKMPKWYKVEKDGMLDKPTQFILAAKEGYFFCTGDYISRDGYAIFVDELEKLPKEDEK